MASLSRTQRRKRERQRERKEMEEQQRYAHQSLAPQMQEVVKTLDHIPLGTSVLPERHRKNYDARGHFIVGPRPCELEAQRRELSGRHTP